MRSIRGHSRYPAKVSKLSRLLLGLAGAMVMCTANVDMAYAEVSPGSKSSTCLAASGEIAVDACSRELNQKPENIDIRIALSNALISLKRYRQATEVLNKGLEFHPGSSRIQEKLTLANSLLEEQVWIEKHRAGDRISGNESKSELDIQTRLNIIRCNQLKGEPALTACNEALKSLPDDPELYRGKADALIQMNRIGEAVMAYEESLRLAPDDRQTMQKLNLARSKRRISSSKCLQGQGPGALEDCNAALMVGASDEIAIRKRRAELLRETGPTDESFAAIKNREITAPSDEKNSERGPTISRGSSGTYVVDKTNSNRPEAADFGRYHALVIGNNDYKFLRDLKTAINDAEAVAKLLQERYNFKVTLLKNASEADIIGALTNLRRDLSTTDNLIIYYAGHGIIDKVTRRGYWLPVDADNINRASWISNEDITNELKAMRSKHVLVVADSCYSGTLARDAGTVNIRTGGLSEWVMRMSQKRSRTVLTSGGIEPVLDWDGAKHSVFSRAFLKTLRENDQIIDMDSLFIPLKRRVALNAEQTPIYSDIRFANHEEGDFIFVPRNRSDPDRNN